MAVSITLTYDIVGEVVLSDLKEHLKMARESLDDYHNRVSWLHRDDVEHQSLLIHHLKYVIEYYGGKPDE
jgi:hypothetical protein